jgi:hypothetical protein
MQHSVSKVSPSANGHTFQRNKRMVIALRVQKHKYTIENENRTAIVGGMKVHTDHKGRQGVL